MLLSNYVHKKAISSAYLLFKNFYALQNVKTKLHC